MIEVFFVACIFYGASFPQLLKIEIDNTMILFRFFDFLNYSIPAALPIYFNLCYSFSLLRLK